MMLELTVCHDGIASLKFLFLNILVLGVHCLFAVPCIVDCLVEWLPKMERIDPSKKSMFWFDGAYNAQNPGKILSKNFLSDDWLHSETVVFLFFSKVAQKCL